jgi:hypothetical protein
MLVSGTKMLRQVMLIASTQMVVSIKVISLMEFSMDKVTSGGQQPRHLETATRDTAILACGSMARCREKENSNTLMHIHSRVTLPTTYFHIAMMERSTSSTL